MAVSADLYGAPGGLRLDEGAVRLLFVEYSREYAALVRETLETTAKGRFEVRHADGLETARSAVEGGELDAVLVDLTPDADSEARRVRIEEASSLATRVPVIVLTGEEAGSDVDGSTPLPVEPESAVREQIARSRLPDEILLAVRRHRRLGPGGGSDPIVLRDPLRACVRLFARVRRSLGR